MEQEKSTLCWDCQRAILRMDLYCPWAWNFIPVDGWKAKETHKRSNRTGTACNSFLVEKCPLFLPDPMKEATKENQDPFSKRIVYIFNGRVWKAKDLCKTYGIKRITLYDRVHRRGMTVEEAIAKTVANKEKIVRIKAFGEELTLIQWSKKTGIPKDTIYKRYRRGEPIESILEIKEDGTYGRINQKKED